MFLKGIGISIGAFLVLTLLIAYTCGPLTTVICQTWGGLLGYDTKYPHCYYICGI